MSITNEDLYKRQYDYDILKANIYAVSLVDILKTQILSADFCVKYILNKNFQLSEEEQLLSLKDVKKYQAHISNNDLNNAFKKNQLLQKKDSFESFETYMNKYL